MRAADREADIVVVGTGAGGATAARALQRAGLHVLMIEEGPDLRARPSEPTMRDTMLNRFREFGAQLSNAGGARIPLIQGRAVGGSTTINSAIFWRLPEDVHASWAQTDPRLGKEIPYSEIAGASDEIERDLAVRPVAREVMGRNNLLLEKATRALGTKGNVIRRMENGCEGTSRCQLGCPNRRRNGMQVSYIPDALAAGAELLAGTKVERVRIERSRAIGVDVRTGSTRTFVRARRGVVLAAGAVHSPWLLLRSGIRGAAGDRFTAHPGFSVAGIFDEPVHMTSFGATQGYESTELKAQGMKIEGLGLPKAIAAARLPGAGATFRELSGRLDHLASWGCLVRLERHGRIGLSVLGRPRASLTIGSGDLGRMLVGMKHMVKLFFAAGARRVLPGIAGGPSVIERYEEIEAVTSLSVPQLSMVATHLFGGAVLGSDPSRSVVDPGFQVHGVEGLWVADASVIPTTLGVNPQGTIMALARIASERIAHRGRVAKAA